MPKYHFDSDPLTGTTQYLHVDQDGTCVLESLQDASDIIEHTKRRADLLNRKKDLWYIGSIPNQLCLQWAQESGTRIYSKEWMQVVKRNIQLSEYRKFNPNNIKL